MCTISYNCGHCEIAFCHTAICHNEAPCQRSLCNRTSFCPTQEMAAEERLSNTRVWPLSYFQRIIAIAGAVAAANNKKGDAARASSSIGFPVSVSATPRVRRWNGGVPSSFSNRRICRHARRFNELPIAFSLRCSKLVRPPASETSTPPLASSEQVRRIVTYR
jgi:hypothetical protein